MKVSEFMCATDYPEFAKVIKIHFANHEYDRVIELATSHQQTFLALSHIILANAYINRAVYKKETPDKNDFINSFIHITLALKYSRDSVELFLHNDIKFSFALADHFIKSNISKYQVYLSKADWDTILKTADTFYQEHSVSENIACN